MRRPFTIRRVAIASVSILAVAAFLRFYGFLASVMPYTAPITATIFVVLTALACFCVFRTFARWKAIRIWRRIYAAVAAGASSALLLAFLVLLAQNPNPMCTPGQLWAIWNIQRLGGHVQIDELRGGSVGVELGRPPGDRCGFGLPRTVAQTPLTGIGGTQHKRRGTGVPRGGYKTSIPAFRMEQSNGCGVVTPQRVDQTMVVAPLRDESDGRRNEIP